jgi:hypothetical protein
MKKILFMVITLVLTTGFAKDVKNESRKPSQFSDVSYPFSCSALLENGYKLNIVGELPKGDGGIGYATATISKGSLKKEINFNEINVMASGSDCKSTVSCDGANLVNFFIDISNKNENTHFRFASGYRLNMFKTQVEKNNEYITLKQRSQIVCNGKQKGSYQ